MSALKDLTGKKIGRWTVVSRVDPNKLRHSDTSKAYWNCICECGTRRMVVSHTLNNGRSNSCGCIGVEMMLARVKKRATP